MEHLHRNVEPALEKFTGRVTHVASGDTWGGAEAFVFALATEQHRERPGQVSCVIMNPGRLASALMRAGVQTLVLDEAHSSFFALLRELRDHIASFEPHVVHAHRQKENLLALLSAWHQKGAKRIARITTVHGMPEPVRARSIARTGIKHMLNAVALRIGFDAVVAVSHDIAATLAPRSREGVVRCIHNGIAVPPRAAISDRERDARLHLVALGRLVPIKRFDRLKQLSDELARAGSCRPLITLAGDGPLRTTLQNLFGDPDGADFRMPGFLTDTAPLLSSADALVITSDHEGIPMAVLEALSAGVPVFGFAVGGLPEILSPGVPLHLVPPGDTSALAAAISAYFSEHEPGVRVPPPPTWSFDIRHCTGAYEELYKRVSDST